mgnify:CR=1 FL=1
MIPSADVTISTWSGSLPGGLRVDPQRTLVVGGEVAGGLTYIVDDGGECVGEVVPGVFG